MKGNFYKIVIRPIITYGAEYWLIKKQHMHKMCVAETSLLRWIGSKTRNERIRNEGFRDHLRVALIGDKIRDPFEMVWTCPTHTNNGASEEILFYVG